jgi:hypothetical protein
VFIHPFARRNGFKNNIVDQSADYIDDLKNNEEEGNDGSVVQPLGSVRLGPILFLPQKIIRTNKISQAIEDAMDSIFILNDYTGIDRVDFTGKVGVPSLTLTEIKVNSKVPLVPVISKPFFSPFLYIASFLKNKSSVPLGGKEGLKMTGIHIFIYINIYIYIYICMFVYMYI